MKTTFLALIAICATDIAVAAVKPGENILVNGRFEADQTDLPLNWVVKTGTKEPEWMPSGGPGGRPAMRFASKGEPFTADYRQNGLNLTTNGTYRLSFLARTENFSCEKAGVVIINDGWSKSDGIREFPANSGWTRYEATLKGLPSRDRMCQCALFAVKSTGTLDIADARLEAIDEIALRDTKPSILMSAVLLPRIVPWTPRLFAINRSEPRMKFRYFGSVLEEKDKYEATLTLNGRTVRRPLAEYVEWTLPEPGKEGLIDMAIIDKAGGSNVCARTFAYGTVVPAKGASMAKHRRLNNLVTEVLAANLPSSVREPKKFEFSTARDGWVFVKVSATALDDFEVRLDGQRVMDARTDAFETFRRIPSGDHSLDIRRAGKGKVVVRQVVKMDYYSPNRYNHVDTNPKYDWEFLRKHVFRVSTSMHGTPDAIKPYENREWRGMGREWYSCFHTVGVNDPDEIVRKICTDSGMVDPWYDGTNMDEQSFGRPEHLQAVTDALWKYQRLHPENGRILQSCTIGKPCNMAVDQDYFAACVNASRGRGLIRAEVYYRGKETEEEALNYIKDYGNDIFGKYRQWYPLSISAGEIIFGIYTQTPVVNLNHYPSTDYKYFLEMQYHDIATNPVYDGLAGISLFAGQYADEEVLRWTMRLIRHYAIEGGTEMLSPKFGLSFTPGHIRNNDFRKSLDGWIAHGDVSHDSIVKFGQYALRLYDARGGIGDDFARFRRGAAPNSLSQKAKGFVPGRLYSLQFVTFDVKGAKEKKPLDRKVALKATLGAGAEIRKDLSWTWVDRRKAGGRGYHEQGVVNLTRIVFRATAPELSLTFDDADASQGEELGVTYISLNPYVE